MKRLMQTIAASTALLALAGTGPVLADEFEFTVRADQPGDTISRYVYGQFAEHLGRGIYEGIWVGEDSDISISSR